MYHVQRENLYACKEEFVIYEQSSKVQKHVTSLPLALPRYGFVRGRLRRDRAHDLNEEGGNAELGNQTEESERVVQDEDINIVVDEEFQAIAANKPEGKKKRRRVVGASGSDYPLKKLKEDHDTSGDAGASTIGKAFVALQGLLESITLAVEVGVAAAATVPFVTSSMTPTPEREGGGNTDSISGLNLCTHSPSERSPMPPPLVMTAVVVTTAITGATSASVLGAGTELVHHSLFADSASIACPSWVFLPTRSMGYDQLFIEFNVGAARQTCLSAKVRLWSEHNFRESNLRGNVTASQVFIVEAAESTQISKLDSLKKWNTTLEEEKNILEGQDGLVDQEQCEVVQDEQVKVLSDRVAELDYELMALTLHLDEEFYPRFLTTIASLAIDKGAKIGQEAGVDHGKAGSGLADIAAYDPSVEAKYISSVLALPCLEFGPSAEAPEVRRLQPSYEQLLLPIHRMEDKMITGETSLSNSLDIVHAPSTFGVPATVATPTALSGSIIVVPVSFVPPISVADYGVLVARPHNEAPLSPKIMFKKEDLDTIPEHPSACCSGASCL
nr:hypothetical protein [Tanacetum cinerariifolium]